MLTPVVQRWRERVGSYRPAREPFDQRACEIAPLPKVAFARDFVERHHYLATMPAVRRCFALYEHNELVGVTVYGVPTRDEVLAPFAPDEAVVLARLVLLDRVLANAESCFVAECHHLLARDGFEGVVSFSDPEPRTDVAGNVIFVGHIGSCYQALNAVYEGRAKPDTVYLLPDGRTFSRRALVKIRKRETGWRYAVEQLVAAGAPEPVNDNDLGAWLQGAMAQVLRKVRRDGNHRYVFPLSKAAKKRVGFSLRYPKFAPPEAA